MDPQQRRRLSKKLAVALRHRPDEFGLVLDEHGWTSVERVLRSLRERGGGFAEVTRDHLVEVVGHQDKPRYELSHDGTRIRARYGHSVPVTPPAPSAPPDVLWHGTHAGAVDAILREGLHPMGRQQVHLSTDRETATTVGRRRRSQGALVLLRVDAAAMHARGLRLHPAAEGTWLTDHVPAELLRIAT